MTSAKQIDDHQARCQPHVLRLWMIARDEAGARLRWQAVADVTEAIDAILDEAESAGSEASAAGGGGPGTFLSVRLTRLAAAADDVIVAARAGDPAQLRRRLHRFEVLTSAIWTVQHAMSGRAR
jgi:hypothetical protein